MTPLHMLRQIAHFGRNNKSIATPFVRALSMENMGNKMKKPAPGEALPGSTETMKINPKHFVLGTPTQGPFPEEMEIIVVATGCFWGAEKGFWRFPGVHSTAVGYIAGETTNPTYEQVCSGKTGHTEAVQVVFDPNVVSFIDIIRQFFECHDPTQGMRQGGDSGTQYRSGIYFYSEEQEAISTAALNAYEAALGDKITTEILPASEFYYAEDYHQQYLAKPGNRQYCSAMPRGVPMPDYQSWCPEELAEAFAPKLPKEFWDEHAPTPHCVLRVPNEKIEW